MGLKGEKEDKIQKKNWQMRGSMKEKASLENLKNLVLLIHPLCQALGGVLNINDVTDHGKSTLRFAAFEMLYFWKLHVFVFKI